MENSFGNSTKDARKHFCLINEKYGKIFSLGQRRYETLLSNLCPSIEEILEICGLIENSSIDCTESYSQITVDELVVAYKAIRNSEKKKKLP